MRQQRLAARLPILVSTVLPLLAAAPAARAATLVVANKAEATVSLVDLDTGEVRATLPTGQGPHEVAVSPDGRRALITDYGAREPGSTLTLIDIPEARVVKTIDLGQYRRPHGVAWLDEGRAVVTAEDNQALLTVDVAAGEVAAAVSTGQQVSHMVAVTPDGSRAFVANIGSGSITAIDLAADKRLGDVATGQGAEGIDVSPDGKQVWVSNRAEDTVTVVDAATLEVLAKVKIDPAPGKERAFSIRAKLTPDGRRVLVTNPASGDLAVLDAASRTVERRVGFAGKVQLKASADRLFRDRFGDSSVPIGVIVEPGGARAYVAHAHADAITAVDLTTWEVVATFTAGREPDGMGYSPLAVAGGKAE